MSDQGSNPAPPDTALLGFELGTDDVPFGAILKAGNLFHQLTTEVAANVVGSRGAVQWTVSAVTTGSVVYQMRPRRRTGQTPTRVVDDISSVIANGLASLEEIPTQPEYFSPRALELAQSLSKMVGNEIPRIGIWHSGTSHPITRRVSVNVARVLIGDSPQRHETGTVEGRLEALNVHSDRVFSVWDVLTGQRIPCHFGFRIPVTDVGRATERRVLVSGEIFYHDSGTIERVQADDLLVLPDESELPDVGLLRGILSGSAERGRRMTPRYPRRADDDRRR